MDVESLIKTVAVIVFSVALYFIALKSVVDAVVFAVMVLYIYMWGLIFATFYEAKRRQETEP